MKHLRILISAFLAGIIFSVGAFAQIELDSSSKIASAILFGACILIMFTLKLEFFDGKIGYLLLESKRADKRFFKCIVTLLGNIIGCVACGLALSSVCGDAAKAVAESHADISPITALVKSVFCGAMLFAASHCYRRTVGSAAGSFIALAAASAVPLCGFFHTASEVFYFSAALKFDIDMLIFLLITVAGNAVGAIVFAELYEAKKSEEEERYRHSHRHHHKHSNETEE